MTAFRETVLSDGLQTIFEQWAESRGPQFQGGMDSGTLEAPENRSDSQDSRSPAETLVEEQASIEPSVGTRADIPLPDSAQNIESADGGYGSEQVGQDFGVYLPEDLYFFDEEPH